MFFISGSNIIYPENFLLYPEKYFHIYEKMCYIRKKFLVCPENFFEMTSPPRRQHFRGKIFRCLFYSKSAPQSLAPPPQLLEASYAPDSVLGLRKKGFVEEPRILQ
jgi:hypothetical protein